MSQSAKDLSLIDTLYKISQLSQFGENPEEALEQVLDQMLEMLPGETATIELINPDNHQLEVEVCRGLTLNPKPEPHLLEQGITGWVALHGKPMILNTRERNPRLAPSAPNVLTEMAVPLRADSGHVVGAVSIASTRESHFSEQDLKVFGLLTMEASRVINRIWHVQQLQEKTKHLETLLSIGRSIVIKRDPEEIIQSMTKDALSLIHARICAVFFLDRKRNHLELRAFSGNDLPANYSERLPLGDSALGTAIRRRKMIEIHDLRRSEEHHFVHLAQQQNLVSLLACPIVFEKEVIGVINLYTDQTHRFNNEEKRLLEILASLGAAAIQNTRLYQRIFENEESLRQNERLTTLGLLSAEIAHEIRNPLTVIRLLFESLNLEFDPADPRHRDMQVISEKLDQLEDIVSRVLNFSKARYDMRNRFDLNELIEDTLVLLRPKLRQAKVQLETDYKPTAPDSKIRVELSKGQFQQALLNLIINALQAMPEGGSIRIATEICEMDNNPCACITVRDTGRGIPESIQDRIFDFFLSGSNEGTGLGLAIVKRILRSHHGDVELVDTSPQGTTIRLWLPLAD